RGVTSSQQLDYRLVALAPPDSLQGAARAAALLADTIARDGSIMIVGDFDADGATSTAVAMLGLAMLGAGKLDFRIPSRFSDGYGLTPVIVERLQQENALPDLLLTVDNGIAAHEGVIAAKQAGLTVVVTDHHLPGETLPPADAIVNPNQPGCEFLSKNAAGVGVMFYLLTALRRHQRDAGVFTGQEAPNLGQLLDLVALGTVADVVPLDHNNRIFVDQGLRRIRAGRTRPGIRALLTVAGRELDQLSASDLGFVLGPRLNAAGRLDDMSIGIHCLLTEDEDRAMSLARELDNLNKQRRTIEGDMREQAVAHLQALELGEALPKGLCLFDDAWHQGVIGILASRIKEQVHRPVIAFAPADNGEIKGSARSIPGVHIRDLLVSLEARHPGLLLRYGGHAMAAGMTLKRDSFRAFSQAFQSVVEELADPAAFNATLLTDGPLDNTELTMDTARLLANAGPWGQQFPQPVFDGEFLLINQRIVGERHLKLLVQVPGQDLMLDAIAFGVDTALWPNPCERVRLVYQLDVNRFRGRESLQLKVDYLEPA
ncbi:MAG: single-stranded-DNA-specific exonuclease RecJ, partial [Halomonadaceae bacterium]